MSEQLLTKIIEKLENMDKRLERVEGQLDENSAILRALEHASQLNTATKQSIERVDAKFDVLNKRLFEQETELRLIKRAE